MQCEADPGVLIRPLGPEDAHAVHQLLTHDRAHLDRWLRWSSGVRTLQDVEELIERFRTKLAARDGFHCGIWSGRQLAGGVVCWYIDRSSRNAEVGYWLAERFTGRGLATRAVRCALDHLFSQELVHRVEMQCGVGNQASRAIPERLGFTMEGIRRESHWITDRFVDHAVYGLLSREWSGAADDREALAVGRTP